MPSIGVPFYHAISEVCQSTVCRSYVCYHQHKHTCVLPQLSPSVHPPGVVASTTAAIAYWLGSAARRKTQTMLAAAASLLLALPPAAAAAAAAGCACDAPQGGLALSLTGPAVLCPGAASRRRDCHFTDIPSASILKHLLKGEGGCSRMTVSPTARHCLLLRPGVRPHHRQGGRPVPWLRRRRPGRCAALQPGR